RHRVVPGHRGQRRPRRPVRLGGRHRRRRGLRPLPPRGHRLRRRPPPLLSHPLGRRNRQRRPTTSNPSLAYSVLGQSFSSAHRNVTWWPAARDAAIAARTTERAWPCPRWTGIVRTSSTWPTPSPSL